jgi:hypothetical protein
MNEICINWDVIRLESVMLAAVEGRDDRHRTIVEMMVAREVAKEFDVLPSAVITGNTQVQTDDVKGKTCVQLRFMCRQRGMHQDGPRTTLVKRLLSNHVETRAERRACKAALQRANERNAMINRSVEADRTAGLSDSVDRSPGMPIIDSTTGWGHTAPIVVRNDFGVWSFAHNEPPPLTDLFADVLL